MDTILLAVTALALAMAAGMSVVVAIVLRQERARAEARVAALGAMASEAIVDPPQPRRPDAAISRPVSTARPVSTSAARPADALPASSSTALGDLEIRPSVSGVSDLFAQPDRSSPWGGRLAVIGCLAAIVVAIGFAVVPGKSRPAESAAQQSTQGDGVPLDLLSLHHAQEAQRLVITGLVQNPRTGAPLTHVVATAFLFGPDGAFLSSSRAPLDFTTLAPGQESPFVVSVPVAGQVSRYRVGFRTEDGQVIAHVDKRSPDALAQR